MSKSSLDKKFQHGDSLISQICDEQLERLRRVGDLWGSHLADWEDLAKAEDSVRREYTGRYLFELLQNANDAVLDWYDKSNLLLHHKQEGTRKRVRIQLTSQSLLIGNEGLPFSESNIRALCRLHISTKTASKQIGHKGIGFKSVLEITDCPEIYSDRYAFGFNQNDLAARVKEVTKSDIQKTQLPILRAPFPRRLGRLSPDERQTVEQFFDQEFVTVIRLPFKGPELADKAFQKIEEIITPQLLLFLEAIDQLEIYLPGGESFAYWRTEVLSGGKDSCHDVILWSDRNGKTEIHSRWLALEPKLLPIRNRSLIEGLGDAWEDIQAVRYSVAFPLSHDGDEILVQEKSQPYHVYFPTEEYSGLKFLINGDFYLEAARKDIRRCSLNDHLAEEIALYIASEGVAILRDRFPKDPVIVDILSWSQSKPDRPFAGYFYEQYTLALSNSSFVPLDTGQYKSPYEIRFPPDGVDVHQFRRLFPPSYLRGNEKWAYPMVDVILKEMERLSMGVEFLYKLGAKQLVKKQVLSSLQVAPPSHIQDRGEFLRFLANWWSNTHYSDQQTFAAELSKCPIVPIGPEWKIPLQSLIFQSNLRGEETPEIPDGFDFSVVPLDAYGEDSSYNGVTAKFLESVKVGPYIARDILRRAILPKLRSHKDFDALHEKYPQSIFKVYHFLKGYFERDATILDIQTDLRKIPVPVYSLSDPGKRVWKPAGEVYFSQMWTQSGDLEFVFGNLPDVYFLGQIDEIPDTVNPQKKDGWYKFFYWLGVDYLPRIVESSDRYQAHELTGHPFRNQEYWSRYIKKYREFFRCSNVNKNHGYSRESRSNYRLDHFEEIIQHGDTDRCIRLFQILGNNWPPYRARLSVTLKCSYITTGCPEQEIPSYLHYCLSEVEWLPVEVGARITNRLFSPADIWNLGDDVRPDVKRMVPSLPKVLQQENCRSIRNDILRTDYSFDDYLGLLQKLPDIYPVYQSDLEEDAQKKWQESIRSVFNWIGQALQNVLARLGEGNWPSLPEDLKVFAFRANRPDYVPVNDPLLVYPDDPFLSLDWEQSLWFLKIDESWGSLRSWLGIASLSSEITTELIQSNKIPNETLLLREKYHETLPYFLCLIRERQFSRYDGIVGRLKRLSIHVVEELSLSQSFVRGNIAPKQIIRDVYLQTYDSPSNRGAVVLRSGDLYVAANAAHNPYLFGDPIASYVEVERLADAFILLFQLSSHEDKIRYLSSKGISEIILDGVIENLKMQSDRDDSADILHTLDKLFGNSKSQDFEPQTGAVSPKSSEAPREYTSEQQKGRFSGSASAGDSHERTGSNNEEKSTAHERPRGKLRTYVSATDDATNGNDGDSDGDIERRREIDKAGIDRVLAYERKHNRTPREMPHLNKGFDIESVDASGNKMYIEVKSLSSLWGERNAPGMTRPQFDYARHDGEQYWLYVVECATQEDYKIYRIQNPAQRVNQYLFDDGWMQLAEPEE